MLLILFIFSASKVLSVNYIKDGYAEKRSYYQGDTVKFYINGYATVSKALLKIYNINNQLVDTLITSIAPQIIRNDNPSANGFGYLLTCTYLIPKSLPSGIYSIERKIFVIVKKVDRQSDIIVVYPTNSEEAYNNSGGKSMYPNYSIGGAATTVSFQRPLSAFAIDSVRLWSTAFLKWIQKKNLNNYSVRYIADADLEDYNEVRNSKTLIVIGHSEYWSRNSRLSLDRFVNTGNHAIILSGNSMWWQVRYNEDKTKMICYKEQNDPIDNPLLKTINWGNKNLKYQPLHSIGADFANSGYGLKNGNGWSGYKISVSNSPIFEGTGLEKGDVLSCPTYEMDGTVIKGFNFGYPIVNNDSLKFCQVEIVGFDFTQCHSRNCSGVGTFIIFKPFSNSGNVMNVSSMDWCGLPSFWFPRETGGMGGKDSLKLQKITENMIVKSMNNSNIFTTTSTKYCQSSVAGVDDISPAEQVSFVLYPNPNSGHFYLESSGITASFSLHIYDLSGRCVARRDHISGPSNEINIDDLDEGIYHFQILSNTLVVKTGKIVLLK
jgi:hypothetical protein